MESHAAIAGHPIHAILVAFPVALFSTVLLLDLAYYVRNRQPFWAQCSYVILILGVLSTLAAAIPGLIDYKTMQMPPLSTRHMAVGLTIAVLFLLQVFLRKPKKGSDVPSVLLPLTIVGVALLGYQGWLGGELVYRYHIGVIPTESQESSESTTTAGTGGVSQPGMGTGTSGGTPAPALSPADLKTAKIAFQTSCANCHKVGGAGGDVGPDLSHEGAHHDKSWIAVQIKTPAAHKPDTAMTPFPDMPAPQVQALAGYLASLK